MGDHAEEEKKNPFDDIINDMTSEWQSYGVPHTSSPAQSPNPTSAPGPAPGITTGPTPGATPGPTPASHVWTSWPGRQTQPQPFYVIGGGEPNPPVFFQADHPPPGFEVDANATAHAVKQNEFFKQHMGPVTSREGTDVIGTVVDIGGGNYVNVVYSGGPGGTVHPQYLSVNPTTTAVPSVLGSGVLDAPTLENILSYPGSPDQGIPHQQQANVARNYGLFREVQPQQIQAMLQQQQQLQQLQQQQIQQQQLQQHHLQQQLEQLQQNQSSQQSQSLQTQHHQQQAQVQSECQPSQIINCQQPQKQQQAQKQHLGPTQQHLLSEQSLQQQQHAEGSLHQVQHLPPHSSQSAQPRKAPQNQLLSTPPQKEPEVVKNAADPLDFVPAFSPNQDLLIQNLVGNWTVPNQTGRYNPFGLGLGQGSEPVLDGVKEPELNKRSDKCVRRTRIVAEVRPMRPSYSAVLTTPSPVPTPQKPHQNVISNNNNNNSVNNNPSTNTSNSANRINSDAPRQKSTAILNGGKAKTSIISPKTNGSVSAGGKLKRQHSSGSDEPSTTPVKSSGVIGSRKPTGLSTSSSVGLEEVLPSSLGTSVLSRCWVSLDDLDNDGEKSNIYEELDHKDARDKDSVSSCKKDVDSGSVRGGLRGTSKQQSQHGADEAFLNNYKTPNCPVGTKGMTAPGSNSNKRPIHINNNLGTTHSPQWGGQQSSVGGITSTSSNGTSTGNSSNNTFASKGEKGTAKGGKSCRTCSDERKGSKNDSKSASSGSGSGSSSRSGRGNTSMSDKASVTQGKRNQRGARRKDGLSAGALVVRRYGKLALLAVTWFFHLLSDVVGMSVRLSIHLCAVVWENWVLSTFRWLKGSVQRIPHSVPQRIKQSNIWCWLCRRFGWSDPGLGSSRKGGRSEGRENNIPGGLSQNISMPATGEEAMKRLLACKGKDPYSILGVTPSCSDDDVKKYYKRQAFLVHPDKNSQPGAEEAFKILVHAFDLIGEPEKRAEYDRCVAETQQVEQAWSELSDLLSQLHQKMEYAANTIRCTNCGKRHKRVAVPRKPFAARFCAQCKIKHSAKEGDIWAETMVMGFLWHYYACMEGAVYDITDWASCQTNNLRHLKPNSHTVQYRIVLGRQRQQHTRSPSEPDLENFLSSLYNQGGVLRKNSPGTAEGAGTTSTPQRQEQTRNRKKGKRNK